MGDAAELDNLMNMNNKLDNQNENLATKKKDNEDNIVRIKVIGDFKKFKNELIHRLQCRIEKLDRRLTLVDLKYYDYKRYYDGFSIFVITLSAILTIFEASKNLVNLEEQSKITQDFLNIIPIVISTLIGLIVSIIKFKKYQDTMENIARSIEKSIFTTFRMKKLKEELYYMNKEDMEKTKQIYLEEIFTLYNQTQSELQKNIGFKDLIRYTNHQKVSSLNAYKQNLKLKSKKKNIIEKYKLLGINDNDTNRTEAEKTLEDFTSLDDCYVDDDYLQLDIDDNYNGQNIEQNEQTNVKEDRF
jgi:hypothetical protein